MPKRNYRVVSASIIALVTVFIAAYDVLPYHTEVRHDTISEVMRDWGDAAPALPFMFAALLGHFFWRAKTPWADTKTSLCILALLAGAAQFLDLPAFLTLPLGMLSGAMIWPLLPHDNDNKDNDNDSNKTTRDVPGVRDPARDRDE